MMKTVEEAMEELEQLERIRVGLVKTALNSMMHQTNPIVDLALVGGRVDQAMWEYLATRDLSIEQLYKVLDGFFNREQSRYVPERYKAPS